MAPSTLYSATLAFAPMPNITLLQLTFSTGYITQVKRDSNCKYNIFQNNYALLFPLILRLTVMIKKTMMTRMMKNLSRKMMSWNTFRKPLEHHHLQHKNYKYINKYIPNTTYRTTSTTHTLLAPTLLIITITINISKLLMTSQKIIMNSMSSSIIMTTIMTNSLMNSEVNPNSLALLLNHLDLILKKETIITITMMIIIIITKGEN